MPSMVTMLAHSDGYSIAPQPPQQQIYFYSYEETQITPFNKALVDFGRPSSPMTPMRISQMIGSPADNSIPFRVPESIIDEINHDRAVPPTPRVYRENSPGGTDRAVVQSQVAVPRCCSPSLTASAPLMAATCMAEYEDMIVAVACASFRWRLMLHSPSLRPWNLVETSGTPMRLFWHRHSGTQSSRSSCWWSSSWR